MDDAVRGEGSGLPATPEVDMSEAVGPSDDEGMEMDPDATLVNDEDDDKGYLEFNASDDEDYEDGDEGDSDYEPQSAGEGDRSKIPRAEWSEDMEQTDEMMRLGLCVNTAVKVAICLECRSVIKPADLYHHVVKTHSMSTTAPFCQGLQTKYDLDPDPYAMRPGSVVKAIFGLDLFEGYITCDACGYACGTKKAMQRHLKKSDNCQTFRKRYVQSFRPSSKRMYFGVELEPTEAPFATDLDPLAYLKKKFAPIPFSHIPIKSQGTGPDANHFLKLEKWDLYVEGKTGADIAFAVREREPELRSEVRICVERFADDVVGKLDKVDNEPRAAMGDYIGLVGCGPLLSNLTNC